MQQGPASAPPATPREAASPPSAGPSSGLSTGPSSGPSSGPSGGLSAGLSGATATGTATAAAGPPAWLLALAGWLLATAALEARERRASPPPAPPGIGVEPPPQLARAPVRELRRLPGIGPLLAVEIEELRWERGGLVDLTEVRGIGPRTVELLRAWLEEHGAPRQPPLEPLRPGAPPGE